MLLLHNLADSFSSAFNETCADKLGSWIPMIAKFAAARGISQNDKNHGILNFPKPLQLLVIKRLVKLSGLQVCRFINKTFRFFGLQQSVLTFVDEVSDE